MLLVLLARILVAGVFVVSAVAKLRDRPGSRQAVADFGLPAAAVQPIAFTLPLVELACAVLLMLADPWASVGVVGSMLLLAAFTVLIGINLAFGRRVDCHCFGQLTGGRTSWRTVWRNLALLAVAAAPMTRIHGLRSVPSGFSNYSGAELAFGLIAGLLIAAVTCLAIFCRILFAQYGSVLLRLEALEAGQPTKFRPAPPFELADLEGHQMALDNLLKQQRPILLVFVSPKCSMCAELLPDLAAWQAAGDLTVAVVSDGSPAANREKLAAVPSLELLLQKGSELIDAYAVGGTPAAFLIGADGQIAGDPAYGIAPIRALHAEVRAAVAPSPTLHNVGRQPYAVGDKLPDLAIEIDNDRVPLREVGQSGVLLFWNSECSFCSAIVEEVAALEPAATITIVTTSEVAEIRRSGLRSMVGRDPDFVVGTAMQVPGTPAAVRVRAGRLDSHVAVGGPEVLALIHSTREHSV